MSLIKSLKDTIKRYNLLSKNDKVLIGVSGGPDSVALTFALNSLRKTLKLRLHIAHLDHRLRSNSYQDLEFVKSLAQKLDIQFSAGKLSINRLIKKGSIEEVAREQRLNFLFEIAKKIGANKIALGHNRDDQAETVLMRLIRGTGLAGLTSILPKRKLGDWIIIRPLIETPRSLIESYLKKKRIQPRIDQSNRDLIYFRNRIRNRLIPQLIKDYNTNIKQTLANMAQIAACDYDYLEKTAFRVLSRLKTNLPSGKHGFARGIKLDLNKLIRLHLAIQRLVLRFSIAQIKGSIRRLNFRHTKEIENLILFRPIGSIVDLPQGICVLKDEQSLYIYRTKIRRKQ